MSFITFYTEISKRLETGSIKTVILFGDSMDRPKAPFVTIKPIAGGDRKLLQIIVHTALGTHETLSEYVFRELPELLKEPLKSGDKVVTVRDTGAWYGPYVDEGDNTLAMSRDFFVPVIL